MKFKEDEHDRAVKDNLWRASKDEVMRFAEKFRDAHVVGNRRSDRQEEICDAAKRKGYRIGLIESVGRALRRDDQTRIDEELEHFRAQLGL